ncbi:unnamed protein product [Cunninghamella echinulata]
MSTMDQCSDMQSLNTNKQIDILERQILSMAPKWQYAQSIDVLTDKGEFIVQIYDHGNPLSNGDDRFLGIARLKPNFEKNASFDIWLRLHPRAEDDLNTSISGEIRIQATYTSLEATKLTPQAFRIIRSIGSGSFGKVYQVEKRDTKRIYAMKVLSKKLLIEQNEVAHTLSERNVLVQSINSPFIVNLKFSFQTTSHLFLVMDYISNGDLFNHLQRHRKLNEHCARFYIAELVCALEDIHAQNVVYRDLKPENILLDAQGHIALTDFGLCKELREKETTTNTFCGTNEYLAPEMVLKKSYDKSIDWWALGILLYELLTGDVPFHSVHLDVLYRRILKQPLSFPTYLSDQAVDLLEQLLNRDPTTRLGSKRGAMEIKQHPFFKGIPWNSVAKKQLPPPSITSKNTGAINIPSSSINNNKINKNKNKNKSKPFKSPMNHPSFNNHLCKVSSTNSIESQVSFLNHPSIPISQSTQHAFQGFSYVRDDDLLKQNDLDELDDDDWF